MNFRKLCVISIVTAILTPTARTYAIEFRSIDGSGNNLTFPDQGRADTPLVRMRDVILSPPVGFNPAPLAPAYEDGIDAARGMTDPSTPLNVGTSRLPNPRDISNTVVAQGDRSILNRKGASDWLWQWGQFIDHDLALEEPTPDSQLMLIPVNDPSDSLFNPSFPFLPFRRNDPAPGTGIGTIVPREQTNSITAYIDGSNVYGSDNARASFLRTGQGGLLKTSLANNGELLLPLNRLNDPFPNANPPLVPDAPTPPADSLFIAGDVRANEQIGLTSVHTLFVREHNRIATQLSLRADLDELVSNAGFDSATPSEVDEYIYQMTRKAVGAKIQAITYNEFLPMLLGENAIDQYTGYDDSVNATLSNEFANAAYRVGHTLLSPRIQLASSQGAPAGSVSLNDAFFDPDFAKQNGVELVLKGLTTQAAQEVDARIVDPVRNFLFAEGNGGLDLAAVNLQRGRDHGLPSYNDMRRGLGLTPRASSLEITSDSEIAAAIALAYDSVDDVDLWLGALAEDAIGDGLVGELLNAIIVDQFTRTRDGDRFFYLADQDLLSLFPEIGNTRLSQVILANTKIERMGSSAFVAVPEPSGWILLFAMWLLAGVTATYRNSRCYQ